MPTSRIMGAMIHTLLSLVVGVFCVVWSFKPRVVVWSVKPRVTAAVVLDLIFVVFVFSVTSAPVKPEIPRRTIAANSQMEHGQQGVMVCMRWSERFVSGYFRLLMQKLPMQQLYDELSQQHSCFTKY